MLANANKYKKIEAIRKEIFENYLKLKEIDVNANPPRIS